jgi:tRNA pseudouridine38-40 synthase
VHALNSLLPQDIRVLKVEPVDSNFQILKQAKRKTYLYFFNLNTIHDPSIKDFSWSLKLPLDIKSMQKAAKLFIGEHDFSLFCSSQSSAKSKVRTIYESEFGWVQGLGFWNQKILVYRITGNGFLKQMVRFIVGTLVQVGKGKLSESEVRDFLLGKKKKKAGPTAPPNGLWLWDIDLKY